MGASLEKTTSKVVALFKTRGPKKRFFGRRLVVRDIEQAEIFAQALSSPTRLKIIYYLSLHGEAGISELARNLNTTKANISMQVKKLEELELVSIINLKKAKNKTRKIVKLNVDRIIFTFPRNNNQ